MRETEIKLVCAGEEGLRPAAHIPTIAEVAPVRFEAERVVVETLAKTGGARELGMRTVFTPAGIKIERAQ
jgi:hypothetical protein